jgi:hypothetical protein
MAGINEETTIKFNQLPVLLVRAMRAWRDGTLPGVVQLAARCQYEHECERCRGYAATVRAEAEVALSAEMLRSTQ